jgi:hypothetical protein
MITNGVRQVVGAGNGRSSPSVAAMQIPRWGGLQKDFGARARCKSRQHVDDCEVNASAWKPQPPSWRKLGAAMQRCKSARAAVTI